MEQENKKSIPVFFACDDNFVKFTIVAITSLKANASKDYHYDIHILYTVITKEMKAKLYDLADDNVSITFDDVTHFLKAVNYRLHVRDYYSKTTYYRLFIPDLYPEFDKAIYLDSDIIVLGDISEMYAYELGDNYVGACNEQAMVQVDEYGTYVEKVVGVDRNHYFNAGVLLINCAKFREKKVLDKFIKLLHEYPFIVTQDEDYLNLICNNKVLWIDNKWDVEVFGKLPEPESNYKIIHYIMVAKPWHFEDCQLKEHFWKYAEQTSVYELIKEELKNYPDEKRQKDLASVDNLLQMAIDETNRPDNYLNRQTLFNAIKKVIKGLITHQDAKRSESRLRVLKKIDEYEMAGRFFEDVEDDPPARQILPGEVDYEQKKLKSKIMSWYAFRCARRFLKKQIKSHQFIIKKIKGLENLDELKGGAMITCNHFNALDSFAIQYVYDEIHKRHKKGKFFRVIREGNYTNFPGFYGMLMKHCNTLPLATDHKVMNEFMTAVHNLLAKGNFVLIYPEQSMWWNYRKPKPLKRGGFSFAAKANVPVLPVFITMEDSDYIDGDGFPVQEYTIHISKPIYPDNVHTRLENAEAMMNKNYQLWKDIYEKTYKTPLVYAKE